MLKVMGQCLDEMRWNDNPQLVLELYALRLTQPFVDAGALLKRLEELEKRNAGGIIATSAELSLRGRSPEPLATGRSNPSFPRTAEVTTPSQTSRASRDDIKGNDAPPLPSAAALDEDPVVLWKRFLRSFGNGLPWPPMWSAVS